jgi:hypothetical protein
MKSFIQYIIETAKEADKVTGNTRGVMHELLTGYYLNNGKHMEKHVDVNGLSPQQAHDKLKEKMSPEDYEEAHQRAKFAAEDLRKRIGGNVKKVQWTSKPGDLKRSTGIEASQNEDPSDIVVTRNDGKHVGVSLKTMKSSEHAPIANPGMEATHGGDEILAAHRDTIKKKFGAIGNLTNSDARKAAVRADPNLQAQIREQNRRTLFNISSHLQKKLSQMQPDDLVEHLRNHVLHAHRTPMQEQGHEHLRHTIWGEGNKIKAKSIDPGGHYEHILSDPSNIEAHHTGQGVVFKYKGQSFARQNIKFDSQDDPLSSVKSTTQDMSHNIGKSVAPAQEPVPKPAANKQPVVAQKPVRKTSGAVGGKEWLSPSENELNRHADDGGRVVDESKKISMKLFETGKK